MKKESTENTKKQRAKLQAEYDYACDMAKNGDINSAREIMQDIWKQCLPILNVKMVISMVHPVVILQSYDFLCEKERYIRAAQRFLKDVLSNPLADEFKPILQDYSDELKKFGINPDSYIDSFAKNYAKDFIDDLANLPDILSANRFLENVSMSEIYDSLYWFYGFDNFLKEFIEAGGDETLLCEKFLNEIGYSSVYEEFSALFDLLEAGCDIDIKCLADCVDVSILNSEDRDRYYHILKEHGADRTILERFAA